MPKTIQIEVWVKVGENGDYDCGCDATQAGERFEESVGTDNETGYRMVRLLVTVPLPEVIELTGAVTETEEVAGLKVA